MKAFSRILALTLTIAMLMTSMFTAVVFADELKFTDVAAGYQHGEAISSLVAEGIINGYTEEDGTSTFKPENTITRAEFAKLLALSTANGVTFTATTNKFPDVALDHWANVYINAAVGTGAINGYEDGTFRPDNPVSYGEAVKMIVCNIGYGTLVSKTEPWYQGYINLAGSIGITKNAISLGDNAAPRGLVAQLIYNIRNAKKVVQTGVDKDGNAVYKKDTSDDDTEELTGVVTAVYEKGLEGNSTGLNKQQIKIDDELYFISDDISIDSLYGYLGKSVDIIYEEAAKKTISSIKLSNQNETLTIDDIDIDSVDGRTVKYYDSNNKEKKVKLSTNLYVVYNGVGVPLADVTDQFIKDKFDLDCGEITFLSNDGSSTYSVAFVTSYETYYVSNIQTNTANNTVTIYDTNGARKSVELNKNDTTVYKVISEGGKKTAADSLSAITTKSIVSVAKPLGNDGSVEVVVSTVTVTGSVTDMSRDFTEATIGNKDYDISDYCTELVNYDEGKYGFDVDDAGTFYLDYKGRVAYFSKSETSDPYAYLVTMGTTGGSSLNSDYEIQVFEQNGSGATLRNYPFKDSTVRINGTKYSASEAASYLADTASVINAGKDELITENATYSQLIKIKKNTSGGTTYVSDIYTIDPDDLSNGNIVPVDFKAANKSEAAPFVTHSNKGYDKLLWSGSSSKSFKYDSKNQFTITSTTIIFFVPDDRLETDDYKRRTYSAFSENANYAVEPYDLNGTSAKVLVVYACGNSTTTTISNSASCVLIEGMNKAKNSEGDTVIKFSYYTAGDKIGEKDASTKFASKKATDNGVFDDIAPGDIVKFAIEGNEVVNVQKVFVDGVLYDFVDGSPFDAKVSTNYELIHASGSDKDYYHVIQGIVHTIDTETNEFSVVPCGSASEYDEGDYVNLSLNDSTSYFTWDSTSKAFESAAAASLLAASDSDADSASKVLVIIMQDKIKAIYIIKD